MKICVLYHKENLVSYIADLEHNEYGSPLLGKIKVNGYPILEFSYSLFETIPKADLYIITSELLEKLYTQKSNFLHLEEQRAFIEMIHEIHSAFIVCLLTEHEVYLGDKEDFYNVIYKKNISSLTMKIIRLMNSKNDDDRYADQIRQLLFTDLSYMVLKLGSHGIEKIKEEMSLLPGHEAYSLSQFESIIKLKMSEFSTDYIHKTGIATVTDDFEFYSVVIFMFSLPDPTSPDERFQKTTLYSICIYMPQLIVMLLPRDPAIQVISDDIYENIVGENVDKVTLYTDSLIGELILQLKEKIYEIIVS